MYFAMETENIADNGIVFYGKTLTDLLDNILDNSYTDVDDHSFSYFKGTPIKVKYEAKLSIITGGK